MNSNFLSAFKVLDLNEGPERQHKGEKTSSISVFHGGIDNTYKIFLQFCNIDFSLSFYLKSYSNVFISTSVKLREKCKKKMNCE